MPSLTDTALALLAKRDHSTRELTQKLRQKGAEISEIQQVVTSLHNQGYLNDARFATSRILYRREVSRWGDTRIKQELVQKGISADLITQSFATQDADSPPDPLATALALLARRSFKKAPESADIRQWNAKEKSRHLAFLLRRGFPASVALTAISQTYGTNLSDE